MAGIWKVLISLFASPIIGFVAGVIIANIVYLLCWNATPRVNGLFKKLQVVTSVGLALSHGKNEDQKTMGISPSACSLAGFFHSLIVPFGVMLVCAGALYLGNPSEDGI